MILSIVAAVDEKNGIGKNGQLPWHISEDLKRFKKLTTGHPVIMGRKTFESVGKPLPNRTNIVITHKLEFRVQNCLIAHSFVEAMEEAKKAPGSGEVFVIGGSEVFSESIGFADKIYLTKVKGDFNCDTFFPDYSNFPTENFIGAGEENGIKYQFLELVK